MLQSIDILVGFTLVMLVFSLAVTTITQLIVEFVNLRGVALKRGVTDLLVLIDRGVDTVDASQISDHILRDPLVGQGRLWGPGRRLATVIQREELTKLLLGFGMDPTTNPQAPRSPGVTQRQINCLRKTFNESLQSNGIPDPGATLDHIRMASLSEEMSNPQKSNSARADTAILTCAMSAFVGKINAWFDQTIDRVSEAFATRTRIVAGVVAILIAGAVQLNAIDVIDRLSIDGTVRGKLIEYALSGSKVADGKSGGVVFPSNADLVTITTNALDAKLISLPHFDQTWWSNWLKISMDIGVFLSALLISLGAPFWYAALKNLLKLRSALSKKDDDQRTERQTTQPGSQPL